MQPADGSNLNAYNCLSYTWGTPFGLGDSDSSSPEPADASAVWHQTTRIHVSCPGGNSGFLFVKKNLHDFLVEFDRRSDTTLTRSIWIDALCINQDDLTERAAQVAVMGDIYRNCESVIIWFGMKDADAAIAFNMMSSLEGITEDDYRDAMWASVEHGFEQQNSQLYSGLGVPELSAADQASCARFLQRSWLWRAWTFQEMMLPTTGTMWCGDLETPLGRLGFFMKLIEGALVHDHSWILGNITRGHHEEKTHSEAFLRDRVRSLSVARGTRYGGMAKHASVTACRLFACSDPRDKIYARLASSDVPMTIDYARPVDDVYNHWALKTSDFFRHWEEVSTRVTAGLPSWVPDHQVPEVPWDWESMAGFQRHAGTTRGDEGNKVEPLPSGDPRVLAVAAFCEDVVTSVGGSFEEVMRGTGIIQSLQILEEFLHASRGRGRQGGPDVVERFWRASIADLTGSGPVPPRSEVYGPAFRSLVCFLIAFNLTHDEFTSGNHQQEMAISLMERLRAATGSSDLPEGKDVLELTASLRSGSEDVKKEAMATAATSLGPYLTSLEKTFLTRRFFITEKGRMGIGSQSARVGDKIFVVRGVKYPWLLREAADDGRYTRLGQTYVEDIMYGEALAGAEFGRVEIE